MCKTHQFTVRHLFDCENCHAPVASDDVGYDGENNWCSECREEYANAEMAHYWPLYKAEKAMGLLDEQEDWSKLK